MKTLGFLTGMALLVSSCGGGGQKESTTTEVTQAPIKNTAYDTLDLGNHKACLVQKGIPEETRKQLQKSFLQFDGKYGYPYDTLTVTNEDMGAGQTESGMSSVPLLRGVSGTIFININQEASNKREAVSSEGILAHELTESSMGPRIDMVLDISQYLALQDGRGGTSGATIIGIEGASFILQDIYGSLSTCGLLQDGICDIIANEADPAFSIVPSQSSTHYGVYATIIKNLTSMYGYTTRDLQEFVEKSDLNGLLNALTSQKGTPVIDILHDNKKVGKLLKTLYVTEQYNQQLSISQQGNDLNKLAQGIQELILK